MTLEDFHEDGQATVERALPGILDRGRVAVVADPIQSGDVASPADDPNDNDNLSDIVSVSSVEGPEEVALNTPAEPEFVPGQEGHVQDGVGHVGRG